MGENAERQPSAGNRERPTMVCVLACLRVLAAPSALYCPYLTVWTSDPTRLRYQEMPSDRQRQHCRSYADQSGVVSSRQKRS